MKKFTLFLLTTLMLSINCMAQLPLKEHPYTLLPPTEKNGKVQTQPSIQSRQRVIDSDRMRAARAALAKRQDVVKSMKTTPSATMKKASIDGDYELITETPEGTFINGIRSGAAYMATLLGVYSTTVEGGLGSMVIGENNEIYIKNIISQYNCGSWIKGTINGSKVTIEFPQKVLLENGYSYYVDLLTYDADQQWFVCKENARKLTLNYNAKTNTLSTPSTSNFASGYDIIGLVDSDDEWTGFADWDITIEKLTDEVVSVPAGLETTMYSVTADGYDGGTAQVGFSGSDVYIQGIYSGMPEAWVKGTISGNKVIFKSGQYMGGSEELGYHFYLVSATKKEVWDDWYEEWVAEYSLSEGDIEFDYDESTKSLTNSSTFLVNAGVKDVLYAAAYDKAVIKPFTEVPAIPAAPTNLEVSDPDVGYYNYGYGWGTIQFDLSTSDVEGNYILPDKLSYVFYTRVNGEEKEMTLSAADYMYLDEDMTEVPSSFSEGWDFYIDGTTRTVYYYIIGPEAFGVQAIYRGAGEEHRSDITWFEVSGIGSEVQPAAVTPAYPDVDPSNVGESIGYGYFTGEEDIFVFGEKKETTYDVAIKLDAPEIVGTYIESITIPMVEVEHISGISAWLSSQLRIEDGKNAPDLTSVSITPEEAGFITVKLDKPYTIPAEGVYVGYTFTVDDASQGYNSTPVALTNNVSPNGFFMHTSAGFLKWLNLADLFDVNSALQVTLGGNKIKGNAVSVKDGENNYVMVNKPFDVALDLTNYGSQGVKSIDVEFALPGQNGVQHFDLAEPVDGFYGKPFSTTLNLSGISEKGNYDLQVKVIKVNGVDNQFTDATATIPLIALNTVPTHKTLIEEYTGTWCGWCPRGLVALEQLAKYYPNDYVRVSYHNDDPMEIMSSYSFPSQVGGFPSAWLDRCIEVDPYYGTGNDEFGVVNDLAARAKVFGNATIEFSTALSADGESIDVNTEVTFPYEVKNGQFAIEYILVSDGLTGEGSDWNQANYYAGGGYGDMGGFGSAESSIPGIVFNDVAVLMSEIGGIKGSIPANVKADEPVKHNYTFQLADALNTNYENVIQDKSKLRVVVLLINQKTGEVVNANAANVGNATLVNEIDATNGKIASVVYYDLGGRRINAPQNGVNVMQVTYSDGTKKTVKIFK